MNSPNGGELKPGETYLGEGDDYWTSGITVGDHFNRIVCYGKTEEDAVALRDKTLAALTPAEDAPDEAWRPSEATKRMAKTLGAEFVSKAQLDEVVVERVARAIYDAEDTQSGDPRTDGESYA